MNGKYTKQSSDGDNAVTASGKKHIITLEYAVDRFNRALELIDRQSLAAAHEKSGELESATAQAIADMQQACELFEKQMSHNRALVKSVQAEFREKTSDIFSKCYFNRARIWPQGYQGDYVMLEYLYDNDPVSPSGIGRLLNKYLLATTLAVAVRERKATLRALLEEELMKRTAPQVLNVASGSCREMLELAPDIKRSGALFTCVDYDIDAINYCKSRLAAAGLSAQVKAKHHNALKMVNEERNQKEFGVQDVIYSVGLFDYLRDEVLTRLLKALYGLLKPGGALIMSFKDSRQYSTFIYHWMIAWDGFFQRTEEEVLSLVERAAIPSAEVRTLREKSGVIMFLIAAKPA